MACDNKGRYYTLAKAQQIRAIRQRTGVKLFIYKCKRHKCYHLTHKDYGTHKKV